MPELRDATVVIGVPGLNGTGVTAPEKTDIFNRLADLEAVTPIVNINDLTDVDTTTDAPATGDLLEFDGTNWVPSTPGTTTVVFGIPFVLDGSGSAITTGAKVNTGILIPFAATYTGWIVDATTSSNFVATVQRAANGTPSTFASLDTTNKPTLSSAQSNSYGSLAVAVTAYDRIRLSVDSATSVYVTVNLIFEREI
jgi:hypothetical protein